MQFSVLASGSGGNACYVETENTKILVDAGLSCRELVRRLEVIGVKGNRLDAVIVTHEHGDHIRGASTLTRRFDLPVFINRKTLERGIKKIGNLSSPVIIETGQTLTLRDLKIETFTKCHDAADPMGLIFSSNGARLGMVTDLGRSTRLVEDRLRGCQAIIVEFNYDPVMLDEGPYPLDVKRRIKGSEGHLSNQQAGDLLSMVCSKDMQVVVLAHLSATNNQPLKALEEAEKVMQRRGLYKLEIVVSQQHEPSPMLKVNP